MYDVVKQNRKMTWVKPKKRSQQEIGLAHHPMSWDTMNIAILKLTRCDPTDPRRLGARGWGLGARIGIFMAYPLSVYPSKLV